MKKHFYIIDGIKFDVFFPDSCIYSIIVTQFSRMIKHSFQFTIVHCPVCGVFIDLRAAEHGLVDHLQIEHAQIGLKPFICTLEDKLGIHPADNLGDMDVTGLRMYAEKLCRQEASAQGVNKMSRNLQKFKKKRREHKQG